MKKTVFVDDLTGDEASTSLTFGLDDTMYEIDLSDENARELRETLDRFVKVARPKQSSQVNRESVVGTNSNSREIRRWAKKQGYNIKGFGRIPQKVMREWEASQGGESPRRRREDAERERALSRNRQQDDQWDAA